MPKKIFHIINRGVEKREIFFDEGDYLRFVINLFRLNNNEALREKNIDSFYNGQKRNKLVEIFKWCLLPNHYHILLQENSKGNAVEFTKRLGNSYTKYINIKYKRQGYLFQNSAKIIELVEIPHENNVPFYIDLNPIDLKFASLGNPVINKHQLNDIWNFLNSYQWSSLIDYTKIDRFPGLLNQKLFYETFKTNKKKYQEALVDVAGRRGRSTWQVDRLQSQKIVRSEFFKIKQSSESND